MVDPGEALLACGGVAKVLRGERPDKEQARRSTLVEDELREAVIAFLKGKRGRAPKVREADFTAELPEDAHEAIDGLEGDTAVSYGIAAGRALKYLNGLEPQRPLPGLQDKMSAPNGAERAAKRRVLTVLEDPIGTLNDLSSVTDDQLQAMQAVYPTLYAALGLAATEAMADVDKELTSKQERAIGKILGVATADVGAFQQLHAHAQQQEQGGGGGGAELESPDPSSAAQKQSQI